MAFADVRSAVRDQEVVGSNLGCVIAWVFPE